MVTDPEKFKRDARTSAELAAEILDHPITPPSPSVSLRRHVIASINSGFTPPVSPDFFPENMVPALKRLEEGMALDERDRRALSYSVREIQDYKEEVAKCRDHVARQSRKPDPTPEDMGYDVEDPDYDPEQVKEQMDGFKRWQANLVETWTLEIANLNQIDKLIRTLAHKLGISLTEPGRSK